MGVDHWLACCELVDQRHKKGEEKKKILWACPLWKEGEERRLGHYMDQLPETSKEKKTENQSGKQNGLQIDRIEQERRGEEREEQKRSIFERMMPQCQNSIVLFLFLSS